MKVKRRFPTCFQLTGAGVRLLTQVAIVCLVGHRVISLSFLALIPLSIDLSSFGNTLWSRTCMLSYIVGLCPVTEQLVFAKLSLFSKFEKLLFSVFDAKDSLKERIVRAQPRPR